MEKKEISNATIMGMFGELTEHAQNSSFRLLSLEANDGEDLNIRITNKRGLEEHDD